MGKVLVTYESRKQHCFLVRSLKIVRKHGKSFVEVSEAWLKQKSFRFHSELCGLPIDETLTTD